MPTLTTFPNGPTALGATLFATGARFRVWAPNASAIALNLFPGGATVPVVFPLAPDPTAAGYWIVDISGVSSGDPYQFSITNMGGSPDNSGGPAFLKTDPAARRVQSSDPQLPGFVVDPSYTFTSSFQTPAFSDLIIYQAHVGSFAGRNDGLPVVTDADGSTAQFSAIAAKIGYVRDLGFNAIQFLPTGEYRGSEGESYNPSNYYAPETLYGTPDALRALIDACHQAGLAVIFDVVYNHMDTTDNLWQFDGNTANRTDQSDPTSGGGIYFSTIETGFGRRPNHDDPHVQQFFIDNACMWFDEYQVDGLRFDSAANFSEGGLLAIVSALVAAYPSKFIHAEDSDPDYIFNQIGFRACWDMSSADGFARSIGSRDLDQLMALVGRPGYPNAYSAIRYLLGSHDQIYNEWDYDDTTRQWYWNKPAAPDGSLRECRWFVERIGGAYIGRSNWFARAQARLGWALNIAIPCTPLLFMGNECLQYGYWNPSLDANGDHRFDWSIAGDAIGIGMRALVRDANAVRWAHPALRSDDGPIITHCDRTNGVIAFRRWNQTGDVVLVVVNLGDGQWADPVYDVSTGLPGQAWQEIFNSQSPQYGGWANSGNYLAALSAGDDGTMAIRLPQWSVLLFSQR